MENSKKLQMILMFVATLVMALAYMVGYFVGKEAGFKQASAKFEVEKKKLLKTLAELNPVSRPIEERVVKETAKKPPVSKKETKAKEKQQVKTENATKPQNQTVKVEEEKKAEEKTESTANSNTNIQEKVKKYENGRYYVQVGIFRNKANALKLASKLNSKGFPTKTLITKHYVKVIVGYYETYKEAYQALKKLKAEGYQGIVKRRKS
ncbi:cell division protein FtsN [Desulfurobacterium pacificum]|uniref:Cell division protein FtsN n=1 Tax=Desulfurobacterium pacificum TaxID=240166 RepID=A0ABY1NC58_9BACT|nr:SPOR domain-containing protein [Desulfurobacterium pacificum]SMP06051.1 cell division protein FtsN [Desulfurobacterium pacificum]